MIGKRWLVLAFVSAFCILHSALGADYQRLIGPVRLPYDLALAAKAVPEARAVLDKFHKAGYTRAVWAVGALPSDTNAIADWVKTCLAAFPEPPILALDPVIIVASEKGARDDYIGGAPASELDPSLNSQSGIKHVRETLGPFLLSESALEAFLPLALPHVHSVMINYTHLNNLSNKSDPAPAIACARRDAELARQAAQATGRNVFLWLHVDDGQAAGEIKEWVDQLGGLVDGFELYRFHEWNGGQETGPNPVIDALLQSGEKPSEAAKSGSVKMGKPVLRGGFRYSCPRLRPGIEQDLKNQYRDRMKTYEAWIKEAKFAGYIREIGPFIPGDISPNMNLLP